MPGLEGEGSYLLATAGADSLVRMWLIEIDEVSLGEVRLDDCGGRFVISRFTLTILYLCLRVKTKF